MIEPVALMLPFTCRSPFKVTCGVSNVADGAFTTTGSPASMVIVLKIFFLF
jgi:hypothetical protein